MATEFRTLNSHSAEYFGDTRDHWWNLDFLVLMANSILSSRRSGMVPPGPPIAKCQVITISEQSGAGAAKVIFGRGRAAITLSPPHRYSASAVDRHDLEASGLEHDRDRSPDGLIPFAMGVRTRCCRLAGQGSSQGQA